MNVGGRSVHAIARVSHLSLVAVVYRITPPYTMKNVNCGRQHIVAVAAVAAAAAASSAECYSSRRRRRSTSRDIHHQTVALVKHYAGTSEHVCLMGRMQGNSWAGSSNPHVGSKKWRADPYRCRPSRGQGRAGSGHLKLGRVGPVG